MVRKNKTSSKDDKILKCVVIGDGYVGKTCLLSTFVNGTFPANMDYVPTVFENHSVTYNAEDKEYSFVLFDTAGQEDYDRLRSLAYYNADVFILCFALDSIDSFKNITALWIKELRGNNCSAPIILVGTKSDLIESRSLALVPDHRINKLSKNIKADTCLKCSAMKQAGISEVFDAAFQSALKFSKVKNNSTCIIL